MHLTTKQFDTLIEKAVNDMTKYPSWRYGQAVWNNLSVDIMEKELGGEFDFFYWEDDAAVTHVLYDHYLMENEK